MPRTARRTLAASTAIALVALAGCAGSAIRSQSPELETLANLETVTRFVGDYTAPYGLNPRRIENAALVTGLPHTGSDPPPGPQRQMLVADMQSRGVVQPHQLLASPATSLVWVRGYLPPAARRGDRFDVLVEVPPDHETTSLAEGWLMETRLAEMAVLGNTIRDGHELGVVAGPLLVDPVTEATRDSRSEVRARVLGGGVCLTDREIGLVIAPEHRSFAMSKRLGDWINKRFSTVVKGVRKGVAAPQTDRYIRLEVPPTYRWNLPRYIRVVRSVAVIEPPEGRHTRLRLLARQLADPVTAPLAALRLEAIGRDAIPPLREALGSPEPEVRFAAAEALAYLGESIAAPQLAEAARALRTARPAALAALAVLDDANGIDALESLLDCPSAETRYGAFRGLWRIDPDLPSIRGEQLGETCSLHVLDVGGPALVHLTRSYRPEVVFFGTEHALADGLRAEAGRSIVVVVDDRKATVSRFVPGQADRSRATVARAEDVVRAIVEVGGGYPDIVQFLQQAAAQHALPSRLAFEAIPTELDGRGSVHEEAAARGRPMPDVTAAGDADAGAGPAGRDP